MSASEVHITNVTSADARGLILQMSGGDIDHEVLNAVTPDHGNLWVGYIGDRPVCAWGLVPPSILSDRAYLWLYAGPRVDEHTFLFVRYSRIIMDELRKHYPYLYGVCDVNNHRAVRWLKWLGAKFDPPKGEKMPFHIGSAA